MRVLVVLGAVLILSVINAGAAPTKHEGCEEVPKQPEESCDSPAQEPEHYRKETLDTISKNTSEEHLKTKTKSKEKIKVKHLKNGMTKTIIEDSSRTKTKKNSVTDEYNQMNHSLNVDGLEDDTSLTQDVKHVTKETDVIKKKDREVIITDRFGNVVSDTKKEKVKEKTKKKEKEKKKSKLVHKVKHVAPPADFCDQPPVEPDC